MICIIKSTDLVLTGLRDCQHPSPPSPCSLDQPPPSPPLRADSQTAAVTRTANSSGRHSPRRARSAPRCWRTPSCPRSPTWLLADGGRLSRRETIKCGEPERIDRSRGLKTQNDKRDQERRAAARSDLHHASSLLRAGWFMLHGSDYPLLCFVLEGKLRPRPLYYLLLLSTSSLCGGSSFCVVFLTPTNLQK